MFALSRHQIDELNARIEEDEAKLNAAHRVNEVSQRLATMPWVGPISWH